MSTRLMVALAAAASGLALIPAAASAAPFELALPIPEVLTGAKLDIRMQESEVQLRPGPKTRMWTYNGSFPGPTIRRPSGSVTRVTFSNDLPASAGSMSVHHHGAHSATTEDGQPHEEPGAGPGGLLVAPGGAREYRYDHVEEGKPERAAFQWYHDHRMDVTGRNVWNGLAGMFILDDDVDAALPLPKGQYDVPLMVVDRKLDAQNQLSYPADLLSQTSVTGGPPNDGATGDVIIVNGAAQPHFEVADRKYRLRLLNASNFRTFDFKLSDGSPMTQIATESGLLPTPVDRGTISLGPAERAEVVVDFAGLLGRTLRLTSAAGDVMEFRVNRHDPEPDKSFVPATLRPAPDLGASAVDRVYNFGLGFDDKRNRVAWTINGQVYDHGRTQASPKLGTTETWQLTNTTSSGVPHYIHIHGVDWRVVSRNGRPPPAWEAGLKETVKLDPNEVVVVRAKFTDHKGSFVFHCHMLEHEDNGMMANFAVVGEGDAPPGGSEQSEDPAPDAAFEKPGLRVRIGRRVPAPKPRARLRYLVQVLNTSQRNARRVAARVTLPAGFRRIRGGRTLRTRTAKFRVARMAAGTSRSFTVRARAPRRFAGSRLRITARVTGLLGGRRRGSSDTLSYRVRRGSARGRAATAAGTPAFVCVLER